MLKRKNMSSTSKSSDAYHIRSISLPSRSLPSALQIEEELNKLKTWEASSVPTAEKINYTLIGLEKLYKCIDDLLSLPVTQQALSHYQHNKWVNELLDQSMRLLDICGSTRDVMSQVKEQVRDLQSALRRRKGDSSIESNISKYTSFARKTKKDAERLISALNQIDNRIGVAPLSNLDDHHIISVIRVLREVSAASISLFQSSLLVLHTPASKPQPSRWTAVSKLIHKGATARKDQSQISNELERIECHIEGTESGLESTFRSLVKTRASLLNILSQ